jgi:hypothetical protein
MRHRNERWRSKSDDHSAKIKKCASAECTRAWYGSHRAVRSGDQPDGTAKMENGLEGVGHEGDVLDRKKRDGSTCRASCERTASQADQGCKLNADS